MLLCHDQIKIDVDMSENSDKNVDLNHYSCIFS